MINIYKSYKKGVLSLFLSLIALFFIINIYGHQLKVEVSFNRFQVSKQDSILFFQRLGDSLMNLNKNEEAEIALRKAFLLSKNDNDPVLAKKTGFELLDFLWNTSNDDEEMSSIALQLKDHCFELKDTICAINSLNRMAAIKKRNYKYVKALDYYDEALALAKNSKDTLELWNLNVEKGNVYFDIEDSVLARQQYFDLIQILPKENFDLAYTITHINIASTYKHPDSVIFYSKKALKNSSRTNLKREFLLAYNNIA
jgi:tetratricopeptide (TPR) repeat protein